MRQDRWSQRRAGPGICPEVTGRPSLSSRPGSPSFGDFERMIHFRIVGCIWLISGLISAMKFPSELWSMGTDQQYGITTGFHGTLFWISLFLVEQGAFTQGVIKPRFLQDLIARNCCTSAQNRTGASTLRSMLWKVRHSPTRR